MHSDSGRDRLTYQMVIAKAIADWQEEQLDPVQTPLNGEAVGQLGLSITKALEEADLIDAEPLPSAPN